MRRASAVLLVMGALLVMVPLACADAACPDAGTEPVLVTAVEARLEFRLADGRRLRLVGLEPAARTPDDPALDETGRTALTAAMAAKPLKARILSDRPDRWGRLPATVHLDGEASPGGLARLAIARGLARYLPEAAAHECREPLLAAEAEARAAGLGLWHDPYYGVLAVDDQAAFAERSATIVLAEGRLRRVDPGPYRTKLRFAGSSEGRRGTLVAVVLPKVVKRFEEQGVRFEALIGRTLRLRGLLDLRFGPQIEIADPDALEILQSATPQGIATRTEAP